MAGSPVLSVHRLAACGLSFTRRFRPCGGRPRRGILLPGRPRGRPAAQPRARSRLHAAFRAACIRKRTRYAHRLIDVRPGEIGLPRRVLGQARRGHDGTLGVASSARPFLVAARFAHKPQTTLVVVAGEDAAIAFARQVAAYLGDERVMRFPERADYPWGGGRATRPRQRAAWRPCMRWPPAARPWWWRAPARSCARCRRRGRTCTCRLCSRPAASWRTWRARRRRA